jgi:alcohol dehydrogenase
MLPHVVRFNAAASEYLYAELAADLDDVVLATGRPAAERIADWVAGLLDRGRLAGSLAELGIITPDIPALAAAAATQWTAGFNPRTVGVDDLDRLYEAAR